MKIKFINQKRYCTPSKIYLDESKGVPLQDIWNDIAPVQGASKENVFIQLKNLRNF